MGWHLEPPAPKPANCHVSNAHLPVVITLQTDIVHATCACDKHMWTTQESRHVLTTHVLNPELTQVHQINDNTHFRTYVHEILYDKINLWYCLLCKGPLRSNIALIIQWRLFIFSLEYCVNSFEIWLIWWFWVVLSSWYCWGLLYGWTRHKADGLHGMWPP